MKVAIVSERRSYLFQLAIELMKHKDVEVVLYSMLPVSRCRKIGYTGSVVSSAFPLILIAAIIEKIPFLNPYQRSLLRIRLRFFYDWYVSRQLKKCDVLIGSNGSTVKSSIKAKKRWGSITICDQGSSHILTQNAIRMSYSNTEPPILNTNYMLRHYDVADYLMAPSIYVKKTDIENGIPEKKILYNPYGVDLGVFRPSEKTNEHYYDVIMVGAWWKHKACDMLAEACINKLGVSLLHVGAVIDCELPKSSLFKHIGFVPESELPKYYAQARVFAMPSLDEGFGLVLLQAAACGLPIVGSARTGSPDVARLLGKTDECITIDEPLTVDNIAAAIKHVLENMYKQPERYGEVDDITLHNISWEAYGERYYNILESVIKNHNNN